MLCWGVSVSRRIKVRSLTFAVLPRQYIRLCGERLYMMCLIIHLLLLSLADDGVESLVCLGCAAALLFFCCCGDVCGRGEY